MWQIDCFEQPLSLQYIVNNFHCYLNILQNHFNGCLTVYGLIHNLFFNLVCGVFFAFLLHHFKRGVDDTRYDITYTSAFPEGKLCLWGLTMLSLHLNRRHRFSSPPVSPQVTNTNDFMIYSFVLCQVHKETCICLFSPPLSGLGHRTLTGTTTHRNGRDNRIWGCVLWRAWLRWGQTAVESSMD